MDNPIVKPLFSAASMMLERKIKVPGLCVYISQNIYNFIRDKYNGLFVYSDKFAIETNENTANCQRFADIIILCINPPMLDRVLTIDDTFEGFDIFYENYWLFKAAVAEIKAEYKKNTFI